MLLSRVICLAVCNVSINLFLSLIIVGTVQKLTVLLDAHEFKKELGRHEVYLLDGDNKDRAQSWNYLFSG